MRSLKRPDRTAVALAVAGVLSAFSLAGIFIVYLVNTVGGDDNPPATVSDAAAGPTGAPSAGVTPSGQSSQSSDAGAQSKGATPATTNNSPAPTNDSPAPVGAKKEDSGDRIPDNQQYVRYTNRSARYSILYPKGWKPSGPTKGITIQGGASFIHLQIATGPPPTVGGVRKEIRGNPNATLLGGRGNPGRVSLPVGPAIRVRFTSPGGQDASGKTVELRIDAYRFSDGKGPKARFAGINLATPSPAYRDNANDLVKIINSFRWL